MVAPILWGQQQQRDMAQTSDALTFSMTDDLAYVKRVVEKSGTSFLAGMKVLPKLRRDAMFSIYAFCREVDDIADEPGDLTERRQALQAWRDEIDSLYAGAPNREITRALLRPVADYDLPREEFLAVIDGMEMDLQRDMRAPSMEDLTAYIRRVAVAVGLLSVRAFGAKGEEADQIAFSLGEALQITNILRDLNDDLELGRLYLPKEYLEKHGITDTDPNTVLKHPHLPLVCQDLAVLARERFAKTRALLDKSTQRRALKPSILMMEVYERTLDKLVEANWQNIDERVSISSAAKLWIFLRYGLF